MIKIKDISEVINFILLVIIFIIATFLISAIIIKLTGRSPESTEITNWFLTLITVIQGFTLKVLFDLQKTVYKHLGEHKGYRMAKRNQQKT